MAIVIKETIDNLLNFNLKPEEILNQDNKSSLLDEQEELFEFTNNLGVNLTLSVEDFLDFKIVRRDSLKKNEIQEEYAVLELPANSGPICFQRDKIMEVAKKIGLMKHKVATKYDQTVLRLDVIIEDMHPVREVPVELNGIRAYSVEPID